MRGPPPLLCPGKSSFSNVGSGHVDNDIDSPTSTPSQHISDTSTPEVFKFIYAQQCLQVWHLYKKCCGSGSAWIRLDPELLTLSRTLFIFSGSTQLGKRRFYKFYFICELETWFTVGLKWQIICRFFVSFNLRCVVHNLVGLHPEPHGCKLLPGSGYAWMRTFTCIRIHMDANFYLDPDPHPEFGQFNLHMVPEPEWIISYSQHCM